MPYDGTKLYPCPFPGEWPKIYHTLFQGSQDLEEQYNSSLNFYLTLDLVAVGTQGILLFFSLNKSL